MKSNGLVAPMPDDVPYVLLIHTGANHPQLEKASKWDDGSMEIIVNPGSNVESQPIIVTEKFPVSREDHVRTDVWLPEIIGEPKLIKVDVSSHYYELNKDALYVREITIIYNRKCYRFPINNYIYPHNPLRGNPTAAKLGCPPHVFSRSGPGTLKSSETEDYILKAREEDLSTTRAMVPWSEDSKLKVPRYVNYVEYVDLPRFLKFKEAKLDAFLTMRQGTRSQIKSRVLANKLRSLMGKNTLKHFPSFEAYNDFILENSKAMKLDKIVVKESMNTIKRWKLDIEFGRQMLIGPNPVVIYSCKVLGERWKEAPALPGHLFNGDTLENVIANNKIYEINTDDLKGVNDGGLLTDALCGIAHTWYTSLADCLFYVDNEENLRPFAIRLHYENGGQEPTFWYPPEDGTDESHHDYLSWMLAKMYFRNADINVYALCTHFGRAHGINEAFACSMFRNLPRAHPIHKLLHPHLAGIIPINVQARLFLTKAGRSAFSMFLNCGDGIDDVLENYFSRIRYENFLIPKDFETRGIADIPNFYFRDDALTLWNTIHLYVTEVLHLAYNDNNEVDQDEELAAFNADMVDNGLRELDGAGFPRHITNIADLADLLTMIIFNVSVFHAAVNFQTMTFVGFIPNVPCTMVKPPPTKDEIITLERILLTLPVEEIAFAQMNTSYNLGVFSPTEKFYLETRCEEKFGMLGESMLVGEKEVDCMDRLMLRMRGIRDSISERNSKIDFPYDVISPNNIPLTTQT